MSLAELFLRLGCSVVGWLMVYAYGLWLAVVPRLECVASGSDPLAVSLGFAVLTGLFVPFLSAAGKIPGMAAGMRWFAAPLLLILPYGLFVVAPYLWEQSAQGLAVCAQADGEPASLLERAWAPVQLTLLVALGWAGWRALRMRESATE